MATKLLITSIFLSLLSISTSHTASSTLLHAAEILSNSGFLSMSLTLQLVSKNILITSWKRHSRSPISLTIFSPSESAFASSGQPSLSLLQFHFSPLSLTPLSLKSLPCNSKIPTLFPNHSLIITSSPSKDCNVSLNGVKIDGLPIYDDGSLVIFGVDEFFNPGYRASGSSKTYNANLHCGMSFKGSISAFEDVSEVLRSKGYSVMAAFLELQLLGFKNKSDENTALTVFAPLDDLMMDYIGNVNEYSSLFFRHIVPCKISWSDLASSDDEVVVLTTFLEGFKINVTRSSDDLLMLNRVALSSPDVYYSDRLVVHGIREVLAVPERKGKMSESPSSENRTHDDSNENAPDHGEF